ncbi:MAG: PDZ domain-containing protein [Akkermansiaceae bacterium]|nr:PDZ domain-containing protein [Akkermansiaceae bacterium]
MNKTTIIALVLLSFTHVNIHAQDGVRMPDPYEQLSNQEIATLKKQAISFFSAAEPAVKTASRSIVNVNISGKRVAYGTAVTNNQGKVVILTKWSEISNPRRSINISTLNGKSYSANVDGVYPEHDLALLSSDAPLKPLDLKKISNPELGSFLAVARPDGKVDGIGVVSVMSRSLREKDKAYLGVMMDFSKAGKNGVPLMRVMPDSAAKKAGLRNGDIVMSVNKVPILGAIELRNLLQRLVPGSETTILYRRNGDEKVATVKLGSRADNAGIKRVPRKRMERMQRMGTSINRVRSNFPNVVQSDIPINPEDTGAPVLDLDGKLVGITIARSSRIKTFITPAETLLRVLASDPNSVTQADKNRLQSNLLEEANKASNSGEDPAARIRRLLGDFDK